MFTMYRRIVFSILVIWALAEAILTARDMPTFLLRLYVFLSGFVLAMSFVGLLCLLWGWVANKLHPNGISRKS